MFKRMVKTKTFWAGVGSIATGVGLIASGVGAPAGIQLIATGLIGILLRNAIAKK